MTDEEPVVPKELTKKEPKQIMQYENVLTGHSSRMGVARSTSPKEYAMSVETYAVMCPPEISDKALSKLRELGLKQCEYSNITVEKMVLYDDLWRFINKELSEAGWMFKKSTWQIGIED